MFIRVYFCVKNTQLRTAQQRAACVWTAHKSSWRYSADVTSPRRPVVCLQLVQLQFYLQQYPVVSLSSHCSTDISAQLILFLHGADKNQKNNEKS